MTKPVCVNIRLPAAIYEELRKQAFVLRIQPGTLARQMVEKAVQK